MINNEIQGEEEITSKEVEDRDDKIRELSTTVHSSEVLCKANKKSETESTTTISKVVNEGGTANTNIILDLTPAPISVNSDTSKTDSINTGKKVQNKLTANKQIVNGSGTRKEVRNTTNNATKIAKTSSNNTKSKTVNKTKIAGKTVDFQSEKAQYLHLTFAQIQELAMKQKGGQDVVTDNTVISPDKNENHCPMHSQSVSDAKKFNTLPRQKKSKKDISQSPDIVKEAEASKGKYDEPEKTIKAARNEKSSKSVGRSKSFNLKSSNEKKGSNIKPLPDASDAKQIRKKEDYKSSKGGGLFAPTQSWLNYMNDRKNLATKDIKSRSSSVSRSSKERSVERSVSPRRRVRDLSSKSDNSTASGTAKTKEEKSLKLNENKIHATSSNNTEKRQTRPKISRKTIANGDSNGKKILPSEDSKVFNGVKVESEIADETQISEEKEVLESTNETAAIIDESSEPATQVIKKFETKISEVSQKTSFQHTQVSTSVTKSSVTATSAISDKKTSVAKSVNSVKRTQSMSSSTSRNASKSVSQSSSSSAKGTTTNTLHSNSNGLSKTSVKKQQVDSIGKGISTKMETNKNQPAG